ncbi:hypothetical protein TrST_g631 [Triparma strigata]|uniref:Uncharacterized protein n=1 Tax=Triparma strigata TaxID=1606541 RepID=A0A9W7EJW6_9STRA|nr:hypothetical protein TrST_g631 [Triparma strigata]
MNDDVGPGEAEFSPTHIVMLDELSQAEKETYYDLMIASNAQYHRDYEKGEVIADMRILGPGVKIQAEEEEKKRDEGPRLTPQEKLAMRAADSSITLPGAITTATGDVFNYKPYEGIVKLIRGKGETTYKPKRRPLAWVMRLVHEILDVRYARDTTDLGDDEQFDENDPDEMARKAEKEERFRQANAFPIFVIDLFSKKYGLKSLVESTTWDLLYSCDILRRTDLCPDVDVFCRFIEMYYDADELLYYCYVRSLTQSVLNASFKAHWGDPGKVRDSMGAGIDRRPAPLTLNRRECTYIAQTIFIRNQGDEIEHEKQMYTDFMNNVDDRLDRGEIDSSDFMQIAVERYFITRPADEEDEGTPMSGGGDDGGMAPIPEPSYESEDGGGGGGGNHPMVEALISGQSVESAEADYIDKLMVSDDFTGLPEEVRREVEEDLAQELHQRIEDAESKGGAAQTEEEFKTCLTEAMEGFDAMAKLVAEHVNSLKSQGNLG